MHSLLARAVENKNITWLLIEVKTTVPVKRKGLDTRMLVLIFTEGFMIHYSFIHSLFTNISFPHTSQYIHYLHLFSWRDLTDSSEHDRSDLMRQMNLIK